MLAMTNLLPRKAESLQTLPYLVYVRRQGCVEQGNATIPNIIDHFLNVTTAHEESPLPAGEPSSASSFRSDDIVR